MEDIEPSQVLGKMPRGKTWADGQGTPPTGSKICRASQELGRDLIGQTISWINSDCWLINQRANERQDPKVVSSIYTCSFFEVC